MNDRSSLRMIVVYDNNPFDERLKTDWGFSCLVEGLEKSILFDTGGSGEILLSNMEKLGIRPKKIDVVVLSHAHRDHTGGLEDLLVRNSNIEVWLPYFFPLISKTKSGKWELELSKWRNAPKSAKAPRPPG